MDCFRRRPSDLLKHKAMRNIIFYILVCGTLLSSCIKKTGSSGRRASRQIKVMTYNIHHTNPPSKPGVIDIDSIVEAIRAEKPDLVALQEVDVYTERSGPVHQAKAIAQALDMYVFFGKAIEYQGGEYGVAILSRYPLSDTVVHKLPTKPGTNGEPRVLAVAQVTLPDGTPILFGSTHLDAQKGPANRQMQIDKIADIAALEDRPFIIAGDFNAKPGTKVIQTLDRHFRRTCQKCKPTIPAVFPTRAIDFIAHKHPLDKFSVISHYVVKEKNASDHRPVVAVLAIGD